MKSKIHEFNRKNKFTMSKKLLLILAVALTVFTGYAQEPSAAFQVDATDKGFLMPRVTTTQRNAIATPAEGLQVYDTDTKSVWVYDGTAWVAATATSGNWVEDTNGDIVLDYATAVDSVKHTTNGFKIFDKDGIATLRIDPATLSSYLTSEFKNSNASRIHGVKSSKILTNDSDSNAYAASTNVMQVDGADTHTTSALFAHRSSVEIDIANANNNASITGINSSARHFGTGVTNAMYGSQSISLIGLDSRANNITGGRDVAITWSSQNIGTMNANVSDVFLRGNGNVTRIFGNVARITNLTRLSSSNITDAYSYATTTGFDTNYTGTVTNYYDFHAASVSAGGGTITNKYGVYIEGNDKTNYFAGSLGIGTDTPGAKLSVVGLAEYADNAAAMTAGLVAGDFYRTADGTVKVVF